MTWLFDPAVLGFLMVVCFCGTAVSLDRAIDEYDHWRATRPTKPGTDLVPVLPTRMRERRDRFITDSITVVTYDAPLPVPVDNELELAEVSAS